MMINPKFEVRNTGQLAISNSNSYMVNDKCMANGQWQMVNVATKGSV